VADNAGVQTARLGVETGVFPLFEVEDGVKYTMSSGTKNKPVEEYLKVQKRYHHLSDEDIAAIQADVDEEWGRLTGRASASRPG
jgi:pyruvate/2-oxoacid:ferredoxin oxidoreductase beta subunit|tara:strand:+ start:649 stop:900 length:252 start_codon:yes stop_codon:yes gene_type:complete